MFATCCPSACAGSSIWRRPGSCSRLLMSRNMFSSIYLTENTMGARSLPSARSASVPTATAATIAGRPANCWMSAVRRPGLRGFWARTAMVRLGIAASRPRSRSRLGASCVRKSATAGSPGERKSLYLI
jgi:hypothetical protein